MPLTAVKMETQTLIFVYNADSGLFNTLTDVAHKIFSPQTYNCNLCALTHTHFGMRNEWKEFIESLRRPVEFLHADEARARYSIEGLPLPLVLTNDDGELKTLVDASSINDCRSLEDLKRLITKRLSKLT
jgi:hypothetical protein